MPLLRMMEKEVSLKDQYFYEDCIVMLEDIVNQYLDKDRNILSSQKLDEFIQEIIDIQGIYTFQKAVFEKTLPEYQQKKEELFSRMQELSASLEVKLQQDREYKDADFYRAISFLSFFQEIRNTPIEMYELPELEEICREL